MSGTTERLHKEKSWIEPVTLRDLWAARQAGFDRVVFEFSGKEIPGYEIEYFNPNVSICNGDMYDPYFNGPTFLRVRLSPMHRSESSALVSLNRLVRRSFGNSRLAVAQGIVLICQFLIRAPDQAGQDWMLGLASRRATEYLNFDPTRLALDIAR